MSEQEMMREFMKLNDIDAENLLNKLRSARKNQTTHLLWTFNRDEQAVMDKMGVFDEFGNLFYVNSFSSADSHLVLYVFQLDHLDGDTEALQEICHMESFSFIPLSIISGRTLTFELTESQALFISMSDDSKEKKVLFDTSRTKQKVMVELGRFLADKYDATFHDKHAMTYPTLIFVPEVKLLTEAEPLIFTEHIADAMNELYARYFNNEFQSSVFVYTALTNHFAIYEKSHVQNFVTL